MKKALKLTAIILLLSYTAQAQVGINTLTPDTTAILHIYSNTKGVLLPILDSAERAPLTVPAADGLLVYDSIDKVYYFFNRETKQWLALNPFQTTENRDESGNGGDDIRLAPRFQNRNVVIGGDTAAPGIKLHVKGNIKADTVHADSAIWSTKIGSTTADITGIVHAGSIQTSGNIQAATMTATTINATNINGRIPVGAIVMWDRAFSTIPPCWNIVPEMVGRFPAGVAQTGGLYRIRDSVDNTGKRGINEVALTIDQMPRHNHSVGTDWSGTPGGDQADRINHNASVREGRYTNFTGGTSQMSEGQSMPHENRPPFYGIYFIKKTSNNCPD